jgi:C-terminal peptidase prc
LDVSLGETAYQEFLGDDTTSRHGPLAGRVLYVATNGLAAGIDLKEHSLFGQALLNGLQGGADKDGYEPDGQITTEELGSWLDKEMPRLKREFAPDVKRVDHYVVGAQTNRFGLTYNPEAHARVEKQVEKLVQLVKDKQISEKLAQEGKGLLERMPNLEARQALRKEYQKLVEGNQTLDQFQQQRDKLLESMKISATSARSFAKKVMDAVAVVTDRYVKETNPGDLVNNAIRGTYRRLDEPVPQDVSDQLVKAKKMAAAELTDLLVDVRTRLGKREDLDDHKDVDLALQRMLSPLDPYTTYVGPVEKTRFKLELEADYSGIGATIRKDEATDLVRIVSPIKGGPAYKMGIQADDLIETITRDVDSDGIALAKTEVLETKDMAQTDVVRKLLGKAGTKVTLSIRRGEKSLPFVIERGRVQLETVVGFKRLADDSWDFMIDPDKKIGYVRLTQFAPTTAEELKSAMRLLKRQGMKALVLDLRFNPGGMLDVAGDVADVFIDDQLVVSIRPRRGRAWTIAGKKEGSMTDFPMVSLVNGHSASASEIVSACLQDHDRAKIAGSRSYGKGSVQTVMDFDGGSLKLTFATFWRPNGKNLNKLSTDGKDEDEWGVKPDKGYELVLPKGEEDSLYEAQRKQEVIRHDNKEVEKAFKDRQLDLALESLRKK